MEAVAGRDRSIQAARPSYRWYDAAVAAIIADEAETVQAPPRRGGEGGSTPSVGTMGACRSKATNQLLPGRLCGFESRRALQIGQRRTPDQSDTRAPAGNGGASRMVIVQR